MQALLTIMLALGALSLLLTVITQRAVTKVSRSRRARAERPQISVLRPLKGDEPGLYENLRSIALQDYPGFEILFGCRDAADPALAVARRVMMEFPNVPMRIVSGAPDVGLNPKVNNLRMLSARARHDWVLVCDSSVRVGPGYLRAMTDELAPEVGMVSSLLVGEGERSLGARLDNLHLNTFIARAVCSAARFTDHPCVIGKSMLFRLSTLEKLGGFELVDDVLAEDYVLGRAFADAGQRVALSTLPLPTICVQRSVAEFVARHVRWGQMRRQLAPALYPVELLQSPIPWLLSLSGLALLQGTAPGMFQLALFGLCGTALRVASDAVVIRALRGSAIGARDCLSIVLKDVLVPAIWLLGALKRTVTWRGNVLRIAAGSRLVQLGSPAPRPRTQQACRHLENA